MSNFVIKQNDLSPSIQTQLLDGNGDAVDITGNLGVTFHMRMAIDPFSVIIDEAATVVDATTGTVRYDWSSGDTDTNGVYQAEFEVIYADSKLETFPNDGYITVNVIDDIA
jgi:hypothetical protein